MKLYGNPASPYVRKVRALAIETDIEDRIEFAQVALTPVGPDAEVSANNPIGKIKNFWNIVTYNN